MRETVLPNNKSSGALPKCQPTNPPRLMRRPCPRPTRTLQERQRRATCMPSRNWSVADAANSFTSLPHLLKVPPTPRISFRKPSCEPTETLLTTIPENLSAPGSTSSRVAWPSTSSANANDKGKQPFLKKEKSSKGKTRSPMNSVHFGTGQASCCHPTPSLQFGFIMRRICP